MQQHSVWARALVVASIGAACVAQERAALVGRVVDPAGEPVAGAMVAVTRRAGAGMNLLDVDYANTRVPVARQPTDRSGRFALQLPIGVPVQMVVDCPPHARWIRDDVLPGEELCVQLERPAALRGYIRLADGVGLPARLRVWNAQRCKYVEAGRTGDDGAFLFERLPSGPVTVAVIPDAARAPMWREVPLTPGETTELPLVTDLGRTLSGRVTDAGGRPLAGAVVGAGWVMRHRTQTDADGRYRLVGFGAEGYEDVHCHAAGVVNGRAPNESVQDDVLDFTLARGAVVTGQLRDAAGQPVAGAYVAAIDEQDGYHNWKGARSAADGTFRLAGVRGEAHPLLFVRLHGYATEVFHLPAPQADAIEVGSLTLRRPGILRGRLLDDGEPVVDRELTLRGCNADHARLAPPGPAWARWQTNVATRAIRTNAHGEFAFGDLPPGTYELGCDRWLGDFVVGAATDEGPTGDGEPLLLDLSR